MYKILLATHGDLAKGLKNTLKMFSSDIDHVHYVSLDESGVEVYKQNLLNKMKEIYVEGEEVLVLADLFGGTPFNIASIELKSKYNGVEIIAGVNLPLLIEATLMKEMNIADIIDSLMESASGSIQRFEETNVYINTDDE